MRRSPRARQRIRVDLPGKNALFSLKSLFLIWFNARMSFDHRDLSEELLTDALFKQVASLKQWNARPRRNQKNRFRKSAKYSEYSYLSLLLCWLRGMTYSDTARHLEKYKVHERRALSLYGVPFTDYHFLDEHTPPRAQKRILNRSNGRALQNIAKSVGIDPLKYFSNYSVDDFRFEYGPDTSGEKFNFVSQDSVSRAISDFSWSVFLSGRHYELIKPRFKKYELHKRKISVEEYTRQLRKYDHKIDVMNIPKNQLRFFHAVYTGNYLAHVLMDMRMINDLMSMNFDHSAYRETPFYPPDVGQTGSNDLYRERFKEFGSVGMKDMVAHMINLDFGKHSKSVILSTATLSYKTDQERDFLFYQTGFSEVIKTLLSSNPHTQSKAELDWDRFKTFDHIASYWAELGTIPPFDEIADLELSGP